MSEDHPDRPDQPEQPQAPRRRARTGNTHDEPRSDEPTTAPDIEFRAATKVEPAGYVIHDEIKAWVRREMTLAASGVDEDERKKLNP